MTIPLKLVRIPGFERKGVASQILGHEKVACLLLDNKCRNEEKVRNSFLPNDANAILYIPLKGHREDDEKYRNDWSPLDRHFSWVRDHGEAGDGKQISCVDVEVVGIPSQNCWD
ncbi:unnamed protein product [Citrullus colocynthis]|uniref:N-acetyltransferase domain-containing protein n=1 Tax=Citrullus colocynthis TaxID=252529 RepID=A0ABP0YH50_9ROSI